MGNMQCPMEDAALLASVGRDICPFPDYNNSPHFTNMFSLNSSLHLRNHYAAVQSSLEPKELEDFTRALRTTFGREGRVTLGGVGVVALSLAIFFDSLAKEVKGKYVPESGPIPDLFVKEPRGYYPPHVYMVSQYLRLVPYIANNPERMKAETESYLKQLRKELPKSDDDKKWHRDDIVTTNRHIVQIIEKQMQFHFRRMNNTTNVEENLGNSTESGLDEATVTKSRKRRLAPPEHYYDFSLNCDPETASTIFLAEVQRSNDTFEAFKECQRSVARLPKTWLEHSASLVWLDFVNSPMLDFDRQKKSLIAQREDFDLKANSLSKWT